MNRFRCLSVRRIDELFVFKEGFKDPGSVVHLRRICKSRAGVCRPLVQRFDSYNAVPNDVHQLPSAPEHACVADRPASISPARCAYYPPSISRPSRAVSPYHPAHNCASQTIPARHRFRAGGQCDAAVSFPHLSPPSFPVKEPSGTGKVGNVSFRRRLRPDIDGHSTLLDVSFHPHFFPQLEGIRQVDAQEWRRGGSGRHFCGQGHRVG